MQSIRPCSFREIRLFFDGSLCGCWPQTMWCWLDRQEILWVGGVLRGHSPGEEIYPAADDFSQGWLQSMALTTNPKRSLVVIHLRSFSHWLETMSKEPQSERRIKMERKKSNLIHQPKCHFGFFFFMDIATSNDSTGVLRYTLSKICHLFLFLDSIIRCEEYVYFVIYQCCIPFLLLLLLIALLWYLHLCTNVYIPHQDVN